ncbi:MAG: hypothetical protein HY687_06095, partial [Chloroflexi bacterium]|nr:hypothetical protein [Chloroflexota bacterium]
PPRPAPAPPLPSAQPALEEVRREAERLLAQALKEADELRRQATTEAEAIRALARAEREAAQREKAEAMAKLAELDSRLHAAVGSPQPAAPQPALTEESPAPPTPAGEPRHPRLTAPSPAGVAPPVLGPPSPSPTAQAPAKAGKRPWSSLFKGGEAKKAVPSGKPAATSSATPAPPGTAANPTETYQGEVHLKITAPVDWPRLHRLEQALSRKSGLALRGTRSTATGTLLHLKLSQPMSLIQALMETGMVLAVLPGGHDKIGVGRLEVTLGEAPAALPPVGAPERQVSSPMAPTTPARPAAGRQGRAYLTVSPLPSLQELGRFQGLLQQIPGVSIVATAAATDRRGAVFTLELKDVSLKARLEEAIPQSRFQEEGPNRFLLALPQTW